MESDGCDGKKCLHLGPKRLKLNKPANDRERVEEHAKEWTFQIAEIEDMSSLCVRNIRIY